MILLDDLAKALRDFLGGDVDGDLAGAVGVQRGAGIVGVAAMIMACVVVANMVFAQNWGFSANGVGFGCCGGFESFG